MSDTETDSPNHRALYLAAEQQAGCFTASQARQVSFSSVLLSHHMGNRRFAQAKFHVAYRLVQFLASPNEGVAASH